MHEDEDEDWHEVVGAQGEHTGAGRVEHFLGVGNKLLVPVTWLREQVNGASPVPSQPTFDVDQLANRVADLVVAKILGAFAALASVTGSAGPVTPGPADMSAFSHEDTFDGQHNGCG